MKKIGIILILIIILPVGFLIFNEIGKLNDTEKVLEETYKNQLEAILFSVNQYSDDIVNSWANKIIEIKNDRSLLRNFITDNLAIKSIFSLTKNNFESIHIVFDKQTETQSDSIRKLIGSLLFANENLIDKLFEYQKSGYRKLEPLNRDNLSIVIFTNQNASGSDELIGLAINPDLFVRKILLPRLQQVSQNQFRIVIRDSNDRFIISSDNKEFTGGVESEKPMWLLPQYKVGIAFAGPTIQDLIRSRATNNILLIGVLLLILLAAVVFVYSAVKKELELAQLKADFVSNVSHELRTPLALISMFAETLELDRVKNDEKKKEYYSIISQEANRLGRIVNSILNFAKMEAGKRKFNFEPTNLNDVIENIFQTYSYHLYNKGFKFEKYLTDNLPAVRIDSEAISEAVINLIDNAIKYSNEKKEVILRTGISDRKVYVEVSDKGIGIAPDEQKKIFDKFYRVSSGLIHNVKGTGIGLSLVKQIVDAHNGKIELESKTGAGSTFRITLFPDSNN